MTKSEIKDFINKLVGETAKIKWNELQFFFAGGKAIFVNAELDLIDVATKISEDNTILIQDWMNNEQLMPVTDEQAKQWIAVDATFRAVVVNPRVLVQDII